MPVAAIISLLLVIAVIVCMGRLIVGVLNASVGNAFNDDDPMFEAPVQRVTRPPALTDDASDGRSDGDDPSQNWQYATLTPLDPEGYAVE